MQTPAGSQLVIRLSNDLHRLESQAAHLQTLVSQNKGSLSGINASLQVVAKNSTSPAYLVLTNYGLLLATVALAIYTARLFRSTRDLARETLQTTKYADRHHQESLTPCVVINGIRVMLTRSSEAETVGVYGKVQNVGTGLL